MKICFHFDGFIFDILRTGRGLIWCDSHIPQCALYFNLFLLPEFQYFLLLVFFSTQTEKSRLIPSNCYIMKPLSDNIKSNSSIAIIAKFFTKFCFKYFDLHRSLIGLQRKKLATSVIYNDVEIFWMF